MKTVELSEANARVLLEYLAPKWAEIATRVAASNAPYNTPWRLGGESITSRAFVARVNRWRARQKALGALLEGFGVILPAVDRSACVTLWRPPAGYRGTAKPAEQYMNGRAKAEQARLVAAIMESAQ